MPVAVMLMVSPAAAAAIAARRLPCRYRRAGDGISAAWVAATSARSVKADMAQDRLFCGRQTLPWWWALTIRGDADGQLS